MNHQKLRPVRPVKRRHGMPPAMRAGLAVILITLIVAAYLIAQGGSPAMSTVPVRTNLPIATYAKLHRAAAAHDTTVDALVAELVRRALAAAAGPQQPPATRKQRSLSRIPREERLARLAAAREERRLERERIRQGQLARIKELHGKRTSDASIGREIGLSQATVSKMRREELKLPANYGFGNGLQAIS